MLNPIQVQSPISFKENSSNWRQTLQVLAVAQLILATKTLFLFFIAVGIACSIKYDNPYVFQMAFSGFSGAFGMVAGALGVSAFWHSGCGRFPVISKVYIGACIVLCIIDIMDFIYCAIPFAVFDDEGSESKEGSKESAESSEIEDTPPMIMAFTAVKLITLFDILAYMLCTLVSVYFAVKNYREGANTEPAVVYVHNNAGVNMYGPVYPMAPPPMQIGYGYFVPNMPNAPQANVNMAL